MTKTLFAGPFIAVLIEVFEGNISSDTYDFMETGIFIPS